MALPEHIPWKMESATARCEGMSGYDYTFGTIRNAV